jgi:hypothetical protein
MSTQARKNQVIKGDTKVGTLSGKGILKVSVFNQWHSGVCGAEVLVKETGTALSTDPHGDCSCKLFPGTYNVSVNLGETGFEATKMISVFEGEKSALYFEARGR